MRTEEFRETIRRLQERLDNHTERLNGQALRMENQTEMISDLARRVLRLELELSVLKERLSDPNR